MGCHPVREEINASVSRICVRSPASEVMAVQGSWFRQRVLWLPTWRTSVLAALVLVPLALWGLSHVHGWLSPRAPIAEARYIVVEGWVPDHVVRAAIDWSRQHDTARIFTTGMEVEKGGYLSTYPNYADLAAQTAIRMGAEAAKVVPAPASTVRQERTRAMAAALKARLDVESVPPGERRINLFTLGTHARRSQIHFQHQLGRDWQVGIVSVPSASYPEEGWWRYSEGAKSVISELAALLAQCLGGE